MQEVLTAEQAAEFLQTSVHTVKRRAREGMIPAAKVGREWRFLKSQLLEWLAAGGTRHYEELVDEGLAIAVEEAMSDPANQERKPLEEFLRERGL